MAGFDRMKGERDIPPKESDPLLEKKQKNDQSSEDIESSSNVCCRFCRQYDAEPAEEELISPCKCKGTQQFVHRSCLDDWRSVKIGFAFSHCTTCKAQFHFRIKSLEDHSWKKKINFRILVANAVLPVLLLAVQTVIATIGVLVYLLDKNGDFMNSFSDGWDHILSKDPVSFYHRVGGIVFFALMGFMGLVLHFSSIKCMAGCQNWCYRWGILGCLPSPMGCFALVVFFVLVTAKNDLDYGFLIATMTILLIWQRHYDKLIKGELTKEYVVEDLHGEEYTPPKLNPEHEKILRLLELL